MLGLQPFCIFCICLSNLAGVSCSRYSLGLFSYSLVCLLDSTWRCNTFPFSANIRPIGSTLSFFKAKMLSCLIWSYSYFCFFFSLHSSLSLSAQSSLSRSNVVWVLYRSQNCVWELILCFMWKEFDHINKTVSVWKGPCCSCLYYWVLLSLFKFSRRFHYLYYILGTKSRDCSAQRNWSMDNFILLVRLI